MSAALHGVIGIFLVFTPEPDPIRLPEVIAVKWVSLPSPAVSPRRAAPVHEPAKPLPAPAPAPAPRPPKQVILPKRPAPVSPKPKPKPKPKPLDYDDALAALRDELGEPPPAPAPAPLAEETVEIEVTEAGSSQSAAAEVDPAFLAWRLATRQHLKKVWIVPPDFLEQGLVTGLIVTLGNRGEVLGEPVVTHTSGNPYFDDNTLRALVRASPLPPPPESGDWPFQFSADEGP